MKNALRILIVTPYGRNGQGGIDRLNDSILDNVPKQPGNVTVDCLVTRGKHGLLLAQFIFFYALVRLVIASALGKTDLLHIHLSNSGSSYRKGVLGALARLLGIPYVVHLHGVDFGEFWANANWFLRTLIDRLFLHSTKIIVMGRYWSDVITDRLPETDGKIVILPNATRAAEFEQPHYDGAQTRITFLGQLGQRKGTPLLIDALGRLSRRDDWVAVIAGDGQVDEARESVRNLQVADRVSIPGWLGVDKRNGLLRSTDILVLPSFAENQPMVILEAFAQGVAVISTPVGAIPEVIQDGKNGLLVPTGDVDALTSAIERLLENPGLRKEFGAAAKRDHAARYEIGAYIRRLVAIWRSAVDASRNPAPSN